MSRVKPEYTLDFSGGLNLRDDVFGLAPNESPEMLNVVIDGRGGVQTRKGWTTVGSPLHGIITSWNPRRLRRWRKPSGSDVLLLTHGDDAGGRLSVMQSTDEGATWSEIIYHDTAHDELSHELVPWGDEAYLIEQGKSFKSTGAAFPTTVTYSEINSPTTGQMQCARSAAAHMGYLFVGATNENNGTNFYPTRLRWSHPNQPEAWRSDDYIDIGDGGGKIVTLMSNGDHLLIFQEGSIKALFGYDADSWQLVEVSSTLGLQSPSAATKSEDSAYFYSKGAGVFRITGSQVPVEVSGKLRPLMESDDFNTSATTQVYLGWLDHRLWVSVPYDEASTATEARATLVWDPSIGDGVWTMVRSNNGYGVGPFLQGGDDLTLACARVNWAIVNLKGRDGAYDDVGGGAFTATLRTRWVDGGHPTLKKQWRRPDLLVKDQTSAHDITLNAYRDYDPDNIARTKTLSVDAAADTNGDTIYRGGSLGPARAVQLELTASAGYAWGVDAIVFKYIPRRMR